MQIIVTKSRIASPVVILIVRNELSPLINKTEIKTENIAGTIRQAMI